MKPFGTSAWAANSILICLFCVFAASAEQLPQKREEPWGPVTAGCRASLTADRESYGVGEPIKLKMKVHNVSSTPVNGFERPTDLLDQPHFRIELGSPSGKPVALTELGKRLSSGRFYSGPEYEILPGKIETVEETRLSKIFQLDAPGKYTLTVYRRYGWADKHWLEIPSNTIQFTILPAK